MATLGEQLEPTLFKIEDTLLAHACITQTPVLFTDDGFRAITYTFMSALTDKMWSLMEKENIPMPDRVQMAERCGNALHEVVRVYTGIDTKKLYE